MKDLKSCDLQLDQRILLLEASERNLRGFLFDLLNIRNILIFGSNV